MADETIRDDIKTEAQEPAKMTADGVTVESHKLSEKIEADRYVNGSTSVRKRRRGLRFNKLVPPPAS